MTNESNYPRLKSKRFISLLPKIIEWKNQGFSAEQIIEKLSKLYNLELTLGTYKNYLHKSNGVFYKTMFSGRKKLFQKLKYHNMN